MSNTKPRRISDLLTEFRGQQAAFERKLWERWKPAFDYYDWVLLQAQNAAWYMVRHHRQEAVERKDALFEAQTRLQARAYRTACEVRALLLSGNPDGGLARWRTIHEVLVVMRFLEQHGAETAERFLEYDKVQTAENWDRYDQLPPEWRILPVNPEEGGEARAERAAIVTKYGPSFQNENGWACAPLGLTKQKSRVSFSRLEEVVELDRFRFYVHIASNHVHVNMKGLTNDLRDDLLPTMRGLSAAAGTTLWGLAECTSIMANLRRTLDTEELERALGQAVIDASRTFLEIQQHIEEEAAEAAQAAQQARSQQVADTPPAETKSNARE